jgi:hypothetical protein
MRLYTTKGDVALPTDVKPEIKWTNPFISSDGSQTAVIAFPHTPENLANIDWPNRLDHQLRFVQSRDAWLQFGPFLNKGKLKIYPVSEDEGIQGTFYFANGDLNASIGPDILMTALTWDVRDPYTGTTDQKITQWLDHLTQVMNKTVQDDYFVFPVVVSASDTDSYFAKTTFNWLNGIHLDNSGAMVLDAYSPQVEFSGSPDVSISWTGLKVTVTASNSVTADTTVIFSYILWSGGDADTKYFGRISITIPNGQTKVDYTFLNSSCHIYAAKVIYVNPTTDSSAVYSDIGYGITPFLRTSYVLRQVFAYFGFTLLSNIFDTDPVLKYRCELNTTADAIMPGSIDFSQLVPDVTVVAWLNSLRNRFGIEFIPDAKKNISVISWNDVIDSTPDMDITQFVAGKQKLEWQQAEPLKMSESTSINMASPPKDTLINFTKKYGAYTDNASSSPIVPGVVVHHLASNSLWYNGTRIGSTGFNIEPVADNVEDISAADALVPTICVNPDGYQFEGIYCPFIGARRFMNTSVNYGTTLKLPEDEDLSVMAAFAIPDIQASFDKNYNYYMGSSSCYDGSGALWGSLSNQYWGDQGTFANCFFKKDMLKRNSYHKITIPIQLNFVQLYQLISTLYTRKLYKSQPVIIEELSISVSDRIYDAEIILRTTRQYINTSEGIATWFWSNFVCEKLESDPNINIITITTYDNSITATAQYPVASDVNIMVEWWASSNDQTSQQGQQSGTDTITILKGQTSGGITTLGDTTNVNAIDSVSPQSDATYDYIAVIGSNGTYGNSGYQRSLDLIIELTYDNGYESDNTYSGMQAFTINGRTYANITTTDLQALTLTDYNKRLSDWIAYINANYLTRFPSLTITTDGARVYNTTACPIG